MTRTTLELSGAERDPCNWLHRMISLADPKTRIIYWRGYSDAMPSGRRKEVFEYAAASMANGRVIMYQGRENGIGVYMMEVL